MKICVIGAGYVGLVTAAGLADFGNSVICVDKDKSKISDLKKGRMPFFEPGLYELIRRNIKHLSFSFDLVDSLKSCEVLMIAVGTPAGKDGNPDMKSFWTVARIVAHDLKISPIEEKIIIIKSTVLPGTNEKLRKYLKRATGRTDFHIVSSPEILSQGSALKNFFYPNFILIGTDSQKAAKIYTSLFKNSKIKKNKIIFTSPATAELIKYAANTFLALKISFINELSSPAELIGADISEIGRVIGMDPRIGSEFLKAGAGFGGSCLPKDTKALLRFSARKRVPLYVLGSVISANERQKQVVVKKISGRLGGLIGKKIAVWGLAFKPQTDDVRDAPSIDIINALVKKGAQVRAYDPRALKKAKAVLPNSIKFSHSSYGALKNADVLVIITEWDEFKNPDYDKMKKLMRRPIIIDGRNALNPKTAKKAGFEYEGIGRK